MVERKAVGRVGSDGRIEFDRYNRKALDAALDGLRGQEVDVVVRPHQRTRSLDQNAWIWGVAYPILAEHLGYDKHEHEDLHYALVEKCFGSHFDKRLGQMVPNKRSSKLTTREFSEYMEWLVRFAAQECGGVYIPLPDEAAA